MNDNRNVEKRDEIIYPNRYNFLDKKNKQEINSKLQKKRKKHTIEAMIIIFAFMVAIVVLEFFIFSGFNWTTKKNKNLIIKLNLEKNILDATDYASFHDGKFKGFVPKVDADAEKWSGVPIINISEDGKQAAIFMRSADRKKIYFCAESDFGNPESRKVHIFEVEEEYAKNGNFSCRP